MTHDTILTLSDATLNAVTCNWDANGYRLSTAMEWMLVVTGASFLHAITMPTGLFPIIIARIMGHLNKAIKPYLVLVAQDMVYKH